MLSLYFNDLIIPEWIIVTDIREDIISSLEVTKDTFKLKEKKITITFKFRRNKLIEENKRQELINWIKGDNFKESKLVLPGRSDYYYMAKCTNLSDITGSIRKGAGTIEFTCFNGEYNSYMQKIIFSNSVKKKINYPGNVDVYPTIIFKVISQCNKIKLTFKNDIMDNFIEFNGNFTQGQVIKFEQVKNKVTVNDNLNMNILHLLSKRSKLIGGNNEYQLINGNCEVSIIYNLKYL